MKESIETLRQHGAASEYHHINAVVLDFLEEKKSLISHYCKIAYDDVNEVSLGAFKTLLLEELRNVLISFINKGHEISDERVIKYLTIATKQIAKKTSNSDKKIVPVCPGCRYLDRVTILTINNKLYNCHNCQQDLNSSDNPEKLNLYVTFAQHNRKGYRCGDCERFIPEPMSDNSILSCPYTDCIFSGKISELEEMRHPTIRGNYDITALDSPVGKFGSTSTLTLKDSLSDSRGNDTSSTGMRLQLNEDVQHQMSILQKTISDQKTALAYRSNDSTLLLKQLMYTAYQNIIVRQPEEMLAYLVHQTRNGGLQHKIFQEFIRLLEANLPFTYTKNGKTKEIKTLLHPSLCIFQGESVFDSVVESDHRIDNKTQEIYVGSRKGFYCRPYYLGKLLDVSDCSGQSLMSSVEEYTFFKIIMKKDIPAGKEVKVRHLRVPPHYQMGAMVHLNRIRRTIVDKVYLTLHGKKRPPQNNAGKREDDDEDDDS